MLSRRRRMHGMCGWHQYIAIRRTFFVSGCIPVRWERVPNCRERTYYSHRREGLVILQCVQRAVTDAYETICERNLLTYFLTPWSRVLSEELTGSAANQEIPHIFGTRRFITVLTSVRHLFISWANSNQSPQPPPASWRSILILSSHLRLGLPNGLFPSGFPERCAHLSPPPYVPKTTIKIHFSKSSILLFKSSPFINVSVWHNVAYCDKSTSSSSSSFLCVLYVKLPLCPVAGDSASLKLR